jgi:hypothetical protein
MRRARPDMFDDCTCVQHTPCTVNLHRRVAVFSTALDRLIMHLLPVNIGTMFDVSA